MACLEKRVHGAKSQASKKQTHVSLSLLELTVPFSEEVHPAMKKCWRLAERFEAPSRRNRPVDVALGFLLAVRYCGSEASKACTLCLPVVLPKLDCLPAPLLPYLSLEENERSGCDAGVRAVAPLVTLSFCRFFTPDAIWLSCFGRT